jgi:hypothetical protein
MEIITEIIRKRAEKFCKNYEQSEIPLNPIPKFIINACAKFAKEILVEYLTTNEIKNEE